MIIISKKTIIFIAISVILFIIPFFWLKPGEMDLGGDSNRLYFYDPLSNLKAFGIYGVAPWAIGKIAYNQYFIPFLFFIISLKSVISSPTILIAIFNGFKMAGSFIFVFLIIKELLRKEEGSDFTLPQFLSALLGGLFYTFSPSVIENMRYALVTHSQVFLNPMIFYLLLRYLITLSWKYIWLALLVTLIFSTNFYLPEPPLIAFYPLALALLFLYNFLILKKAFPWKVLIIGFLFFAGLHAFHIIPMISNLFDKGSQYSTRIFESFSKVNVGLDYFNGTLYMGKISNNILLPLEKPIIDWSLLLVPMMIILGFILMKRKNKTLFLVSMFFFVTLFLKSANITQLGLEFYRKLFLIPGFGMFRNFSGQWQWVYTFFYAVFAGLAVFFLFTKLKIKYALVIFTIAIGFLLGRSIIVFNGDVVNVFNRGSKDVKVVLQIDPNYEQMLNYIQKIPNDGKIFHVPFTDNSYNLVGGSNNGVYIGQSMVSLLAGRNDFSGYQDIDPFSEVFVKISKEKNYPLIRQMMSLLQVRYVLYDSNPMISDEYFQTFPYGYTHVPASPSAALDFVHNISDKLVYKAGNYSLFEVNRKNYLPHFYVPTTLLTYDTNPKYDREYFKASSFFPEEPVRSSDPRIAFIDNEICSKQIGNSNCGRRVFQSEIGSLQIEYQKINPTKYQVRVKNPSGPFFLVFQNNFSPRWRLYSIEKLFDLGKIVDSNFNGSIVEFKSSDKALDPNPLETNNYKNVFDDTHIEVNGYANAWYIKPSLNKKNYSFIVEMTGQKIFYYSFAVSIITFIVFLIYGLKIIRK